MTDDWKQYSQIDNDGTFTIKKANDELKEAEQRAKDIEDAIEAEEEHLAICECPPHRQLEDEYWGYDYE